MRIFIIGDHYSGTGPANVTKRLLEAMPEETLYQKKKNKLARLAELWAKIPKSDYCVLSGYSKQNLWALKIAGIFKKPCVYLMHGCVEHENAINGVPDPEMNRVERETMAGCKLILAVSEQFQNWLRANYPEFKNKVYHLTNGVDWKKYENVGRLTQSGEVPDGSYEMPYRILTVGGGMPRKRIVKICEALSMLVHRGIYFTLTVAGADGADTEKINSYPFVRNVGIINEERMRKNLRLSQLYIQNSCFETFGLAPLEALTCGCDLLLSKEVGALSIFDKNMLQPNDIIENCDDPQEIAAKIEYLLISPNNERLWKAANKENTSWESVSTRLQNILKKIDALK